MLTNKGSHQIEELVLLNADDSSLILVFLSFLPRPRFYLPSAILCFRKFRRSTTHHRQRDLARLIGGNG